MEGEGGLGRASTYKGRDGRGATSKGDDREERGRKVSGREFPLKVKVSRINTARGEHGDRCDAALCYRQCGDCVVVC